MTLAELLEQALGISAEGPSDVTAVVQDHRRVSPGAVFVARKGALFDGHKYAKLAVGAGAVAVVGENRGTVTLPWRRVPYISVENDRVALAKLAACFHGHPSEALSVFGVTGTDGKTTTSYLLHHLLQADYRTGLLSTAGIKIEEQALEPEGHFTTPEATEVQRLLARFRDEGLSHAVLESSSHGFALHRLDEVAYELGIWTNLSPEHLDFHGSFDAYREAKLSLMRRARLSVLNRDDPAYALFQAAAQTSVSYGEHPQSDYRATAITSDAAAQRFTLVTPETRQEVYLPMPGRYNVHNALAALAAAHVAGLALETLLARLETFRGVPGRMQLVQADPFAAVVDFAHTAPALEKALQTLRPVTSGRLIVMVGAAGERDPGKRQPLGEVALRGADLAIFTEEDSRSEYVGEILAQMARGAIKAGGRATESYWCISDRREAIRLAVAMAQPGDTLLFAGKGHERSLERADATLAWDEVAEVERALSAN